MSWLSGADAFEFMRQWGWLVGIFWLVAVVLWTANRPPSEELKQARSLSDLRSAGAQAIRGFEALCRSYERTIRPENMEEARTKRHELFHAIAEVLAASLRAMPPKQRAEYVKLLMGIEVDHLAFYHDEPTLFSVSDSPTVAIDKALEWMAARDAAD